MKISTELRKKIFAAWRSKHTIIRLCQTEAERQLSWEGLGGEKYIKREDQIAAAQQIGLQLGLSKSPRAYIARLRLHVKT